MKPEKNFKRRKLEESAPFRRCQRFEHMGWGPLEPMDIEKEYDIILRKVAEGEFEELKRKVEKLENEIELLKSIKKVLVTEEALFELWEGDDDDWWGEL